jgi:hypothetical protein
MNGSKDNRQLLRDVVAGVLIIIVGYIFTMVVAMQKTMFMEQQHSKEMEKSQEKQEQTLVKIGKQWSIITQNRIDTAVNKTNIKWLERLIK